MTKKINKKINSVVASKNPSSRRLLFLSLILIIFVGFLAYANSLKGGFVYDDLILIENNTFIKSPSQLSDFLSKGIGAGAGLAFEDFYRPLLLVTYAINYSLNQLNVVGYHLTNVILHILVALSLYWLVTILFKNRLVSLLTALLFVVHPIHTEAVSYISGRADSLAALFLLLTLSMYIRCIDQRSSFLETFLFLSSFVLALLSKEYAVFLPLLVLYYHWAFQKKIKWFELLSLAGISLMYIALRLTYLKSMLSTSSDVDSVTDRLPGVFVALLSYFKLLVCPFPLHMEYGLKLFQWSDPKVWAGLILIGGILTGVYLKRSNRLILFGAGWFLLMLLPFLNIFKINAYMAEHFLYFPSMGVFLIAAYFLEKLWHHPKARVLFVGVIGLVLLFLVVITIRQNDYWKDAKTFYTTTLKYEPSSGRMYNNLGKLYQDEKNMADALVNYNKAIELNPKEYLAYNNRGSMYGELGRFDEAQADFMKVIELKHNYAPAYDNLGHVSDAKGDHAQAIVEYSKSISLNPNYALAYNNRGSAYSDLGQYDLAIADFSRAVHLNPQLASAYNNRGNAYAGQGEYVKAIADYNAAIALNPNKKSYYRNRDFALAHQK